MKNAIVRKSLQVVVISLLLIVLGAAFYAARYMVLSALIGIGFGVLLTPVVNGMGRLKIPRPLSGVILLFVISGVIAALGFGLGSMVVSQFEEFRSRWPEIQRGIEKEIGELGRGVPGLQRFEKMNLERMEEEIGRWALGGVRTGVAAMAGFVVILALGLYTAINSRRYFSGVLGAFPAYLRPRAREVLERAAASFRGWFKAQLLDMAFVGLATGLGLWLIGVDYPLVLGLLAGVLDIIPYVGPVLAAMASILVTLGTEPGQALWVLGLFVLVQQLEGNLFLPLVMRETIQLPEVHLIILIMLLSSWFGLLGALVAAPLMAVGRTVYLMTYQARMDRETARPRDRDAA